MNRKLLASSSILLLAFLCILVLLNNKEILSILLIFLAFVKHRLYPIKKEFLWYVLITFGGLAVEVILVNIGHGWSYTKPDLFGIPIWIPFFWGLIGTTTIVLYDGMMSEKN